MTGTKVGVVVAGTLVLGGLLTWVVLHEDAPRRVASTVPVDLAAGESGRPASLPAVPAGEAQALVAVPSLSEGEGANQLPIGAAPAGDDATDPLTTLSGRLVDGAGRGVAGARVVFRAELVRRLGHSGTAAPRAALETQSDRTGAFTLQVPVPEDRGRERPEFERALGAARLVAVHEAFATLAHECPPLVPGPLDLGALTMAPGARVVGRTVDEHGRPLAGATVLGRALGGDSPALLPVLLAASTAGEFNTTTSGRDGRFLLTGLGVGAALVQASAADRRPASVELKSLDPAVPTDVGDLRLVEGATIAGWVQDDQRRPVAGARVNLSRMERIVLASGDDLPRQELGHDLSLGDETDEAGHFELRGLGAGPYTVNARAAGYAVAAVENVSVGTSDVRLRLERLSGLLLTILSDADGRPLDGAQIRAEAGLSGAHRFAHSEARPLEVLAGAQAVAAAGTPDLDPAGRYFVRGVGPAGAQLLVRAEGHAATRQTSAAGIPGEVAQLELRLPPESVIEGRVLDGAGRPVDEATVRFSEHEGGDGRFLAPDDVRHEVRHSVRLGGEDESEAHLRTRTGPDGAFRLTGVPAGEWDVVAGASGHVRGEALAVSLRRGESRRGLEIVLEAAGSLAGIVRDGEGQPVAGVDVVVEPVRAGRVNSPEGDLHARLGMLLGGDSDVPDATRRATTNGEGRFAVESLRPGPYDVKLGRSRGGQIGGGMIFVMDTPEANHDPEAVLRAHVVAGEETWVDLLRPARAALEGRVVAAGVAVPDVNVSLRGADDFLGFGGLKSKTDALGRYRFDDVDPGDWEAVAIVPGAAIEESVEVRLESGRTTVADVVFAGATLSGRVVDAETGIGVSGVLLTVAPVVAASPRPQAHFSMEFVTVGDEGGSGGMQMEVGGGSTSKVRSGPQGEYEIRFLKPGRYSIETAGGGTLAAEFGPVEVREGETLDDLPLEVRRGASLSGVVRSGATGQPLDGLAVRLEPVDAPGDASVSMVMTRGGRYHFDGLAAGSYRVSVLGSGFGSAPVASEEMRVEAGEAASLDLRTSG